MEIPIRLMSRRLALAAAFCFFGWLACVSASEEPCKSGPQMGQRCGPYTALISTGPQRGQSYCYICETGDNPAVVIFARTLSDALGKLASQLDKAVIDHKKSDPQAWITFLSDDQVNLDPQVVKWSQKFAIRNIPLGIFEDPLGPPSYRLSKDADVTVLLFVKQKVIANFAFRAGELTDDKIKQVIGAVPSLVLEKKEPAASKK
jgi:hypothetical protein